MSKHGKGEGVSYKMYYTLVQANRRHLQKGASANLARILGGKKLYGSGQTNFHPGDVVVCWGATVNTPAPGVTYINNTRFPGKYNELSILKEAGIPTLTFSNTAPEEGVWLGRRESHIGGRDFRDVPENPDFWTKFEDFVEEYRIHSFDGRSIYAMTKVPATDDPHPWARNRKNGWVFAHKKGAIKQVFRDVAHASVAALGLTFAAMDIGRTEDGRVLVIEANRRPGLRGQTIDAYVRAIKRYAQERVEEGRE